GHVAVALSAAALAPVALLVAVGLPRIATAPWTPFTLEGHTLAGGLGLGLAVVMWNYAGWDTPSTVLGETRAPERAFRRALLLAVPLVAVSYLLPVGVVLASGLADWTTWTTGALPALAARVGGAWLGHVVAAGAVLSAAGLFMALLLTNSRLPYVLARAGALPRAFGVLHPRFGTPWLAVLVSSAAYAACAVFSFKELIVLNVWLYSLALLVELAAFLSLRAAAPGLPRPWRVPGGWTGALAVTVLPALFALGAMAAASTPAASRRAARPPRSTGRTTAPRSRGQTVTTSRLSTWGAPTWPPTPPHARRAPNESWRSSITRVVTGAPTWPPYPPTLGAP